MPATHEDGVVWKVWASMSVTFKTSVNWPVLSPTPFSLPHRSFDQACGGEMSMERRELSRKSEKAAAGVLTVYWLVSSSALLILQLHAFKYVLVALQWQVHTSASSIFGCLLYTKLLGNTQVVLHYCINHIGLNFLPLVAITRDTNRGVTPTI